MSSVAPILVAEDDANDVFLLRRAFKKVGVLLPVVEARNGQEAINYLLGQGPFSNRGQHPFPSLMFLDLKMPLLNGFDVLAAMKDHPPERKLPIVVLTSSNQDQDRQQARAMGADEYCVKPNDFDELVQIVNEVTKKWLNGHRFPHL